MWLLDVLNDLFEPARAARNAGVVLDRHRAALAEVDSVVDRLARHGSARMLAPQRPTQATDDAELLRLAAAQRRQPAA